MKQITTSFLFLLLTLNCVGQENNLEYTKNTLLFDLGDDVRFGGQPKRPLHINGEVRSIPNLRNSREVSLPCYAEISIDTVPAVKLSLAWEQKGFTVSPAEVRDTIGTRVEEVIRIFFYTEDGEKKYLGFIQRNYVSGIEDIDRRFEGYNYQQNRQ